MEIIIDGQPFPHESLQQWKLTRVKQVLATLGRDIPVSGDTDGMMRKLTQLKEVYTYEQMYDALRGKLKKAAYVNKLINLFSGQKACFSKTTIRLDGISAKQAAEMINEVNLNAEQREEYTHINLAACPDHYVLRAVGADTLEVIETTGDSPLPLQFFVTYGDETGLQIPKDPACEHQSVGAARLKDGTLIGGVRHQFLDTDTGVEARLAVQFPGRCPRSIVLSHQKHLACEFSAWLQWIADRKNTL